MHLPVKRACGFLAHACLMIFAMSGGLAYGQQVTRFTQEPYIFHIKGGELAVSQNMAFEECKKASRFYYRAVLLKEEKLFLLPAERYFQCSLLESDSENERPTPLQQRVLQTRRFTKPLPEVLNAWQQWVADAGLKWPAGMSMVRGITQIQTGQTFKDVAWLDLGTRASVRILVLKPEFSAKDPSTTDLRLRTYLLSADGESEVFARRTYQTIFNEIAQQMFIEAIELQPGEIQ